MMMLKIMLDNGMVDDKTIIAFANTGKESEATLAFIHACEMHWGIKIIWLDRKSVV